MTSAPLHFRPFELPPPELVWFDEMGTLQSTPQAVAPERQAQARALASWKPLKKLRRRRR